MFSPFRLFAIFRIPGGRVLTAPNVAIDEAGEAIVSCRTIPAPRIVIDDVGESTVSCANG